MIKDKNILLYFLKGSFSTRKIDEKIGLTLLSQKAGNLGMFLKYGLKL